MLLVIVASASLGVAQEREPKKPATPVSPSPEQTPAREVQPPSPPGGPQGGPPWLIRKPPAGLTTPQTFQTKVPKGFANLPIERRRGTASLPLSRGVRVLVDNRTAGSITVKGWDREVIEARATSERGDEIVILIQKDGEDGKQIFLKADYANLDHPEAPTQPVEAVPLNNDGVVQVNLMVSLPRYAELDTINVIRSNVEIVSVPTPVLILGQSSNLTLKEVGSVEAHTRTGSIKIENARGMLDLTSSTGTIKVANSQGGVHAVSITGPIEVSCVKGRIDVGNTGGPIELTAIDGDVEAIAASSDIRYTGRVNREGRYYLKSMSGLVEMSIPANTPGFNATLTSFRGTVSSDFRLKPRAQIGDALPAGHRLAGQFGNGSPLVTLDSFDGVVKLSKMSAPVSSCP